MNGHGETTHHPEWHKFCEELLRRNFNLYITTNLGKRYTKQDLEVLSKFNVVQVSIDTADDALFRRIRRNVGLDRIIFNINKIRATAISKGEKPPIFTVSCGIYNKNVFLFEDFA